MAPFLRAGTSNVSRRPRLAWAQSRTFERCAPATPQHDPPRALAPPRRAHCPCTARMSALDRIHGRTVWGGCTGGGLACGSLAIHTHHKIPHKWVVHFCLLRSHVHPGFSFERLNAHVKCWHTLRSNTCLDPAVGTVFKHLPMLLLAHC